MGADLVGYIIKGPVELDDAKVQEAEKACKELADLFANDDTEENLEKLHATLPVPQDIIFSQIYDENQCMFQESIVEEFVAMWEGATTPRDFVSRLDPHDKTQQIGFSGGMTWGDTPSGRGYQVISALVNSGIARIMEVV